MMKRDGLISVALKILQKSGFATSDPKDLVHAGFDIVARKGSTILVIKIILNANSLDDAMLTGMKSLASTIDGSCLIIAAKSGNDAIEDGVAYSRSGIPLLSILTFEDLIYEGVPPLVYAASGGFYVNVDSQALRKAREGGLSLGDLAEMAGVSRRTIKMYEDGMNAKMEIALRLEEGLGVELILPQDPLRCCKAENSDFKDHGSEDMAMDIFRALSRIGYSITPITKCPFDAVTADYDVMLFTGIGQKRPGLERRARAIANLSSVLEKRSVMFVDRIGERVNLEGTPLIGCWELKKARDKSKVMELIEERS